MNQKRLLLFFVFLILAMTLLVSAGLAQQPPTRDEAAAALKKAVTFFRERISADVGYLRGDIEDLSHREVEEKATTTQAWLQPPGMPAVGEAYLAAYERTNEQFLLGAAVETARALVKGKLHSGGWAEFIEFD